MSDRICKLKSVLILNCEIPEGIFICELIHLLRCLKIRVLNPEVTLKVLAKINQKTTYVASRSRLLKTLRAQHSSQLERFGHDFQGPRR